MRITARRRDGGQALRDAMKAAGMNLQALARATGRLAEKEDRGRPVSFQLVAFLATEKPYARETTTVRSAELIEDALSVPRGTLFEYADLDEEHE